MIDLSRRQIRAGACWLGGGLLAGLGPPRPWRLVAAAASSELLVLSAAEWKTAEAIGARPIPTDHEPVPRRPGA